MAGLEDSTTDTAVTPGRKTHVVFDSQMPALINSPFAVCKSAIEIGKSNAAGRVRTEVSTQGGVRLAIDPKFHSISEWISKQGYILTASAGDITVPSGWVYLNSWRQSTEFSGAYTGANSDLSTTGGPMYTKQVASGADWSSSAYVLTADQSAYPSPGAADDGVVMDRVMVGTKHAPYDAHICLEAMVPSNSAHLPGGLLTVYFSGPAGYDESLHGYGQYAAKLISADAVELWECGEKGGVANTWLLRDVMHFSNPAKSGGAFIHIKLHIAPWPYRGGATRNPWGSVAIYLHEVGLNRGKGIYDGAIAVADSLSDMQGARSLKNYQLYGVSRTNGISVATQEAPYRVDVRRDIRAKIRLIRIPYYTDGTITDDPIVFPAASPNYQASLNLDVSYTVPNASCTVGVILKQIDSVTGAQTIVAPASQVNTPNGTAYTFSVLGASSVFVPTFTLTGDGLNTPDLSMYTMDKDGAAVVPQDTSETEGGVIQHVALVGAEADMTHEMGSVAITDKWHQLDAGIGTRNGQRIRIETECEQSPSYRVKLMRGFVGQAQATRKTASGSGGVPYHFASYDISVQGAWRQLSEARIPTRFPLVDFEASAGQNVPQMLKVTDALIYILGNAGFVADSVRIVDNPIRLFPVADEGQMYLDPYADLAEACKRFCSDYLGAALLFDPNDGTYGAWTIVYPPRSPYTNKIVFQTASSHTAAAVTHTIYAGGTRTITAGSTTPTSIYDGTVSWTDSTAQVVPIYQLTSYQREPIANKIIVTGSLQISPRDTPTAGTLVYHHPPSYNFSPSVHTADHTSPDYLGREVPLLYADYMLQSPDALRWVQARLIETCCYGYRMLRIYAPLVFIEHEQYPAARWRPLRFGDPVMVDTGGTLTQYVVRNVNPDYTEDAYQYATYELQQVRF